MVTLLSILHEPGPVLRDVVRTTLFATQLLYDQIIIDCTDATDLDTIKILEPFGLVSIRPQQGMAEARRYVLRQGLDNGGEYFHYVDLDRLVFWQVRYPNELRAAICFLQHYDFTIFERSRSAFDSHPELQRLTEGECNTLANCVYPTVDFLAATRGLSREAAWAILAKSEAEGAGVDIEWPLIVKGLKLSTGFMVVNGMGYESGVLGIEKPQAEEKALRYRNVEEAKAVVLDQ